MGCSTLTRFTVSRYTGRAWVWTVARRSVAITAFRSLFCGRCIGCTACGSTQIDGVTREVV